MALFPPFCMPATPPLPRRPKLLLGCGCACAWTATSFPACSVSFFSCPPSASARPPFASAFLPLLAVGEHFRWASYLSGLPALFCHTHSRRRLTVLTRSASSLTRQASSQKQNHNPILSVEGGSNASRSCPFICVQPEVNGASRQT